MTQIRSWDQAEMALAAKWGSFQPRPQQRALAHAVAETVNGNARHPIRLAQAGTGVGKSMGYLIPALASGQRVVVSVSTKALQDQLIHKDLPTLRDTLFPELRYAMLKGRSNYLCLRALDKAGNTHTLNPGATGERSDLVEPVTDEWWRESTVDAEGCVGRKACPFSDNCYSELARQRALGAQVLVVNTSLLTQDLRLRSMTGGKVSLLGDYQVLIVDEAHEMADIVAGGLSTKVTLHRILDTTSRLVYHLDGQDTPALIDRANTEASVFFNSCKSWFDQQADTVRTAELAEDDQQALSRIFEALAPIADLVDRAACSCEPVVDMETGEQDLVCEYRRRVGSLMSDLELFATDPDESAGASVVWMERGRTGSVELRCSPAEVGGWLNSTLWDPAGTEPPRAVLTSATLGIGGDFSYTARRLGVNRYDDLDVGTPFDYGTQSRLYLPPTNAPSPKLGRVWKDWAQSQMADLVAAADGGALILFTSTSAMREAYDALSHRFKRSGWHPMVQGGGVDNRTLGQQFQRDRHSVLFATRSFMTGVDFAGDTCRLVVIDKMPFPVPDEPVFKARCAAVDARFGEKASFRRVSIPEMSLVLVQAFGRLIRTVDDRGVVAILDPRMRAGWAAPIRRALPPAPVVDSVEQVDKFYRDLRS